MYVSLGASAKQCLSDQQFREAVRLCNCKRYGSPQAPVRGFGEAPIYLDLNLESGTSTEDPCDKSPRVKMPSDFNPKDPCEAGSRLTCKQQQAREMQEAVERQEQKRAARAKEEAESYEEQVIARTALRQRLLVGGVVALVLVGAGVVVYRSTRKG